MDVNSRPLALLPRRCAVFGVNGYIGGNLAYALNDRYQQVVGYDIQDESSVADLVYRRFDITSEAAWRTFDADLDTVFFFSGLTGTHQSFEQSRRYVDVNIGGLTGLCDAIRRRNPACRVIFPSTRLVYKGSERPLREDSEKEARTVYAAGKLACEYLLQAYGNTFGLRYTVFRLCLPYGSIHGAQRSYGTFSAFLNTARSGKPLCIYGDGNQRRSVTHMVDLVSPIIGVSELPCSAGEIYNVGGEVFRMKDLAAAVAQRYHVPVTRSEWPAADLRLESWSTVFDDGKLQAVFPYRRQIAFLAWLAALQE